MFIQTVILKDGTAGILTVNELILFVNKINITFVVKDYMLVYSAISNLTLEELEDHTELFGKKYKWNTVSRFHNKNTIKKIIEPYLVLDSERIAREELDIDKTTSKQKENQINKMDILEEIKKGKL